MRLTIYNNARFQPNDDYFILNNSALVGISQIECACWCLNTTMCLTATYSGIDQRCTLFSARLNQGKLNLMATSLMASVSSFKNKTLPAPSRITTASETVYGVWNTAAGQNSRSSSPGISVGTYIVLNIPQNVFDGSTLTEYSSYGACSITSLGNTVSCGQNTGLYLSPLRGVSLLVAFRFYTGLLLSSFDPLAITIEGSNELSSALTLGSSWALIYNGSSGLDSDPGRGSAGVTQFVTANSVFYSSYRILVTSKRDMGSFVSYSELELLGY